MYIYNYELKNLNTKMKVFLQLQCVQGEEHYFTSTSGKLQYLYNKIMVCLFTGSELTTFIVVGKFTLA